LHLFSTINETKNFLLKLKKEGKTIGFVPTMGALHQGHVSLLKMAQKENDITVSSIFVNPLQFNDKKDLEKYPRTFEKDVETLKSTHCDILFAPSVEEIYPLSPLHPLSGLQETEKRRNGETESLEINLGTLDKVMEGTHRPGHFQGVCVVVKKLFDIIKPDRAYFGEKDFQQLAIIKHMVKTLNIPVEIIPCPTLREADGLAMSSRNTLLGVDERKNAPLIFKTLQEIKTKEQGTIRETKEYVEKKINKNSFLKLEYFEIVDPETLMPVQNWGEAKKLRACIAVKAGAVRLIDNISL
jgi:pantoate--beta-alanine ligase